MKKSKRLTAFVLVFALMLSCIPNIESQAKSKTKAPKLNKTKVTLVEGKKVTLKVKNSGGKKVKWSTSNKKVAKVSKGKVTAVKKGTAKVKAKVGKKTFTCKVTVKAKAKKTTEAKTTEVKTTEEKTTEKETPSSPNTPSETPTDTKWDCNTKGHKTSTVVKVQPTCNTMGEEYSVCLECGSEWFSSYIPATGHVNTHEVITRQPTCGASGNKDVICDSCGELVVSLYLSNAGIEHDYEIIESMEADKELQPGYSYLRQGYIKYQCKVCSKKYTKYFNACYHKYTTTVLKTATCSEEGLKHNVCTECGYENYESVQKNSTNHHTVHKQIHPTGDQCGWDYYICTDCGTITSKVSIVPDYQWRDKWDCDDETHNHPLV